MAGEGVQAAFSAIALAAVILLILLAGRAGRLFPALGPRPGAGALKLLGSLPLDGRRRLHLIEAAGHQALVLTGGGSDVVALITPPHHSL
jgi:hypothetical protein